MAKDKARALELLLKKANDTSITYISTSAQTAERGDKIKKF